MVDWYSYSSLYSEKVYIAPSGVQKERMKPEDLFVMTLSDRQLLRKPLVYKPSACTPLFYNAYTMREAGACIHTHSQNAVMATLLYPGETFEISHQEMIKGIRRGTTKTNLRYFDKLVVPIVENTPEEEDLTERMAQVRDLFITVVLTQPTSYPQLTNQCVTGNGKVSRHMRRIGSTTWCLCLGR
jgi:methylthioribulose-1-phosphate dehydratase